jgi:hypothetical protein
MDEEIKELDVFQIYLPAQMGYPSLRILVE